MVAVVGEAPGRMEVQKRRPFVGMSGKILTATLESVGIDPDEVWYTNTCLCHPEANDTPDPESLVACRPRLIAELQGFKKILLCGGTALASLAPEELGITLTRGRALWSEELQAVLMASFHPAKALYEPEEFRDFAKDLGKFSRLGCTSEDVAPPPEPTVKRCRSILDVRRMAADLSKADVVAIDLETTGFNPRQDKILLVGMQGQKDVAWQVESKLLENLQVRRILKDLIEHPKAISAGHNAIFDAQFLLTNLGIDWKPNFDTMLAHYLLDERSAESVSHHGLKTLAREFFNISDYESTVKKALAEVQKQLRLERGKDYKATFRDLDPDLLSRYAARDTQVTWMLVPKMIEQLDLEGGPGVALDRILMPASHALRDIELRGITIDVPFLTDIGTKLKESMAECQAKLEELNGGVINANSPKQVAELLFDKLKLKGPKGSARSTARPVLDAMKGQHEAIEILNDHRAASKILGTFVEGFLERLEKDGRLRTDYLLHGTATGRLASRDPNLQNLPSMFRGVEVRNAFVATEGWKLLEADYSQIEVRVVAMYGNDHLLIDSYNRGYDIHSTTAGSMFHVEPKDVTPRMRFIAKSVVFGILYGRGAPSIAEAFECTVAEAQGYIDTFLSRFVGVQGWAEKQRRNAQEYGYVYTPFGRRRRFPIILPEERAEILRKAVNSPVQSMASDICLMALTRLHHRLDPEKARILLTVHDSILLEVKEEYLGETLLLIKEELTENNPFKAPLRFEADAKIGKRWGSLEALPGRVG